MAPIFATAIASLRGNASTGVSGVSPGSHVGGRNSSVLAYLVPALLCGVALVQRYLVVYHDLDVWKGGGFGMFSAISAQNLRQMTITLVMPDGPEERFPPASIASRIPLAGDMARIRRRIVTMPHPILLDGLAERLAGAEWVGIPLSSPSRSAVPAGADPRESFAASHGGGVRDDPSAGASGWGAPPEPVEEYYRMKQDAPDDAPARPLALAGVRVEVWQYVLDRADRQLKLTKLASAFAEAKR